ncbi:quinone oxidoreductase, putative [Talaromyces stipitatus ATCC 10500]|uniref:Quinone oxidoreductase, putative n=1 Tax=Talaromyces stipitatus (strain ATCC 10500 / CBS 375.48 / QM 6759 / NRRL 1006) TaxID=441959 RepID=B8MJW7_TALSN|nr:quinone oxidoreductase, putative [Talaromyces stipitatus ATCC 10500]EED14784.1 quinone oxidoreductase, putative [Talaromyces stipitatus ATCC 10500]
MYEVIVHAGPKAELVQSPIPSPKADQVVIKVVVSGSNPKDWKTPNLWGWEGMNQGDDIAGIVHEVGSNVVEFKVGDRVAAFHEMRTPGGSYAEYAVAWAHTTFHLPKQTSFEEAATIPLAGLTAALGLFARLRLPTPFARATEPIPTIIYGGSTAVGAFAIKLAQRANIHPLFVVAGSGSSFVDKLIDRSKGDVIIDYRPGPAHLVEQLNTAIQNVGLTKIKYALDAVTTEPSFQVLAKVLDTNGGRYTGVLPYDESVFASGISHSTTTVGNSHASDEKAPGDADLAFAFIRLFGKGLKDGWFTGHPFEVVPNGLAGVEEALRNLKDGKNSALKYVFRIADTPQLREDQPGI